LTVAFASASLPAAAADLQFNRDIRPILSEKCFACHGADAKHREGELRLDEPAAAFGKGKSGEIAIVPNDIAKSEFWYRITTDDTDDLMPPEKSKKELTKSEKATLRQWIEQGAPYQKHWAFEAPVAEGHARRRSFRRGQVEGEEAGRFAAG
jgi:hypothetical protein